MIFEYFYNFWHILDSGGHLNHNVNVVWIRVATLTGVAVYRRRRREASPGRRPPQAARRLDRRGASRRRTNRHSKRGCSEQHWTSHTRLRRIDGHSRAARTKSTKKPRLDLNVSFLVLPNIPGSSQGPPRCHSGGTRHDTRLVWAPEI